MHSGSDFHCFVPLIAKAYCTGCEGNVLLIKHRLLFGIEGIVRHAGSRNSRGG